MNRQLVRAVIGASLLSVAALASAAESSAKPASPTSATSTQGAVGMRVYIDPETGAMVDRPVTAEQKAAADADAAQFSQDTTGLKVIKHPDGRTSVDLEGRFEMATQAHLSADGLIAYSCDNKEHAAQGKHTHAQPVSTAPTRDVR